MFKLLSILSPVLKEFVFDRNRDKALKKPKPKPLVYLIVYLMALFSIFSVNRLYVVSDKAVKLKEEITSLKETSARQKKTLEALIDTRCR